MKDRIKKIRQLTKLNQTEFAKKIALSRSAICKIERGENNPSEQTLKLICKEFNISYLWLTQGIGPMQELVDSSTQARIDNIMTGENDFAKNLFKEFSKLEKEEWALLEKIIKNISQNINEENS